MAVRVKNNAIAPFPIVLHHMLMALEAEGDCQAISWAPHGRSLIFHNWDLFEFKYMPLWFSMSSLASFQRQLNMYAFTRIPSGPDKGGYWHPSFLRGKEQQLGEVKRIRLKGETLMLVYY